MSDEDTPVSERDYDFNPERVTQMDAAQVDADLSNIMSGNPKHPYVNNRDRRHDAAAQYVAALHRRKLDLRPQRDGRAELQQQMKTERHAEFNKLRLELGGLGFDVSQIPQDVLDDPQPFHMDIMRRDAMIKRGRINDVLPELYREMRRLGMDSGPEARKFLDVLDTAVAEGAHLHPETEIGQLAIDTALRLHQLIATTTAERWKTARAKVDRDMGRDRQANQEPVNDGNRMKDAALRDDIAKLQMSEAYRNPSHPRNRAVTEQVLELFRKLPHSRQNGGS